MEFRLFGPLAATVAGREIDLGPPRQKAVLAALLVDAGRVVQAEVLVDRVWGAERPARARHAVQVYVSNIRRLPVPIHYHSGGYVADVDPDCVDLHRLRRLIRAATAPLAGRAELLGEALAVVGGEPLADIDGDWAESVRADWARVRIEGAVAWARSHRGGPAAVIGPLSDLLASYPLVEPLAVALIQALHGAGRSAEALQLYATVRTRLADELGTQPGPELQAAHLGILRGDAGAVLARPAPVAAPVLLPMDIAGFVGRRRELAQLDAASAEIGANPTAVIVSVVSGAPGVGKTALTVHWAHQVADRFPDGRLYVNLRGFDPGGSPMTPAEAIAVLLDSLGVAPQQLPDDLSARIGRYRGLLAGKRMLLLLDNARDAEQVRPLLPGAPGCHAVVTSRDRLPGLVAADGAFPLTVEVLDESDARRLLVRRIGSRRAGEASEAVAAIVERCAGLPLALAIIAARVVTRPGLSLADHAADLRDEDRLDALSSTGDARAEVRSVFSWSYRALSPDAARLFRLLGRHPSPELSVAAAASLVGLSPARARPLLGELTRAYLVSEPARGRYALHDLLHEYAGQLPLDEPPGAATRRMLDHYLHTARAADRLLEPARVPAPLVAAPADITVEPPTDDAGARSWFGAARPTLIAAVDLAGRAGFDPYVWQLADAMATFLYRQGSWHDQVTVQRRALQAATRAGDAPGQGCAQVHLARAHIRLREYDDAEAHLRAALALYRRNGDPEGQARTLHYLGMLREQQGRYRDALDHCRQAVAICRASDLRFGLAHALNALSWYHARLGDHHDALAHGRHAVEVSRDLGDLAAQANAWDTLGYAHHRLGDDDAAVTSFRRAIDLYRSLEDRYYESIALTHLAERHQAADRTERAREAYRQALAALEEIHHPDAEQVRAALLLLEGRDQHVERIMSGD
ncbi:SARP family transcriptional regulator [Nonomuraea sp. TT08I-71]|nr:SARP family transcriptional regulator [Nonomuraea sp. TT08I-71]